MYYLRGSKVNVKLIFPKMSKSPDLPPVSSPFRYSWTGQEHEEVELEFDAQEKVKKATKKISISTEV